jgi:hypothetical protein
LGLYRQDSQGRKIFSWVRSGKTAKTGQYSLGTVPARPANAIKYSLGTAPARPAKAGNIILGSHWQDSQGRKFSLGDHTGKTCQGRKYFLGDHTGKTAKAGKYSLAAAQARPAKPRQENILLGPRRQDSQGRKLSQMSLYDPV